jgi:hypothetical protein
MTRNARRPFAPDDLAQLAHVSPHRVRLRAPLIASRADVCRRIAENLAQSTNPVDKVTVHVLTGSIIVETSAENVNVDALLARLRECVQAEASQFPPTVSGPTKIGQSVARAFAGLNADVRGGLHHRADLATLLPVFLGTLALGTIVTTGRVPAPAWFNFCWWSFRAFLTFNKDAATEEKSPESPPPNTDVPHPP